MCPACHQQTLRHTELEPLLPCYRCERCGGQWIRGEHYLRWLTHPDRKPMEPAPAAGEIHDSTRAMICPECGRLLSRYRVGHGADFVVDHCAGCGGIWLDRHEWESLERMHLADRIHHIFSSAWQAQNLREQQQRAAAQLLIDRIGADHFAELTRMTEWIRSHPRRQEIRAFLLDHL
jgi:Zn-finger nucleic acid-binding protein